MSIYVDQLGYLPKAPKIAVATLPCRFQVIRVSDNMPVYEGKTSGPIDDPCSGDKVYQIDFSLLTENGTYYILGGNSGKSFEFRIGDDLYREVFRDSIRCLYYQRCGIGLEEKNAGIYARPVCHEEPAILLEDYLHKTEDPKTFDMRGGWHDAGDYGRYTDPGAVAVAHLLYAYALFPESFRDLDLNIPESGSGLPDILSECLYELRWLLKMQDRDGGVFHKLTTFRHAEFIMPQDDHGQMIIFPKSSMATADFSAVMALASRVYRPFMPEFAEEMLSAAKRAYKWLHNHPFVGFQNPEGCDTGGYEMDTDIDNRLWATAEMLRVDPANTGEYLKELEALTEEVSSKFDFGWQDVSGLASLAILSDPKHTTGMLEPNYKAAVLSEAARVSKIFRTSGYNLGMEPEDFIWGSNMRVLNRGMLFILASQITKGNVREKYFEAAMGHIHYLFGRNPMNISYVTGYGKNPVRHPHNRVTECDGIEPTIPGFVSGGPFRHFCDAAAEAMIPKGTAPMKCFIDDAGSYSTNEITIYWNSPLIFICAFLIFYTGREF
ncbi:MAG: glycoside hydrolase family 9 protein [Lachnospiraceae bacterium]|nr:glycoside hydrolase family 9 protein [Lachnospiraceae bacterium]